MERTMQILRFPSKLKHSRNLTTPPPRMRVCMHACAYVRTCVCACVGVSMLVFPFVSACVRGRRESRKGFW